MLIGLLLMIIILCVNPFSLLSFFKPLGQGLNQICLQRVSAEDTWTLVYSAIVCGERLPEGSLKKTFISLGIIHLMVISGAHLIFLEKAWGLLPPFRFKNSLLACFLLTYSLSAGLNPPVLRALFSLLLSRLNQELKLFWSPYLKVCLSGLLCLLCQGAWFHSLSLQLSWIASMGMSNPYFSRLKSCVITFILILPVVSSWSSVHPFSIIINWLLVPLAGSILLPFSLLLIPFPFIRPFVNFLWECFLYGLNFLRPLVENQGIQLDWAFSSFGMWVYIALIFIIGEFGFFLTLRKKTS